MDAASGAAEPSSDGADAREVLEPTFFEEASVCDELLTRAAAMLLSPPSVTVHTNAQHHTDGNGSCCCCGNDSCHHPRDVDDKSRYTDVLLPTAGQAPDGVAALLEVRLGKILDRYLESPHLLHPHLEQLMQPLLSLLLRFLPNAADVWDDEDDNSDIADEAATADDNDNDNKNAADGSSSRCAAAAAAAACALSSDVDAAKTALHVVCRALYLVAKTAGETACASHFANDVHHCEDVFYTLRRWQRSPRRRREWEVRYCLLLWLSNLVLVPFDLRIIDTRQQQQQQQGVCNAHEAASSASLSSAILTMAASLLADRSKCRDGAALLLARMLARPDGASQREAFFAFARRVLAHDTVAAHADDDEDDNDEQQQQSARDEAAALSTRLWCACEAAAVLRGGAVQRSSLLTGMLRAVSKTLKLGKRDELVQHAAALLPHVTALYAAQQQQQQQQSLQHGGGGGDTMLCKELVKVLRRLLLTLLPRTSAAWRYKRHLASLADNIGGRTSHNNNNNNKSDVDNNNNNEDVVALHCDALESGLEALLAATAHRDTVVRWCAAKGVGAVCERLPAAMAGDVVAAVLDGIASDEKSNDNNNNASSSSSEDDDSLWHGSLLALAELCRRGVVAVAVLPRVVGCIARGLRFELSRGTYSVGAHVRDAACYACWSMVRAYDADDMAAHVHALAVGLVVTALCDREVNVRRAAAAALQEGVGRLGTVAHGIALVTLVDFYSLASLAHAYTVVAPRVARFAAYRAALLDEMARVRLLHWDRAVQRHAAVALGRIAACALRLPDDGDDDDDDGKATVSCAHNTMTSNNNNNNSHHRAAAAAGCGDDTTYYNDKVAEQLQCVYVPLLLERVTATTVSTRFGAVLGLAALVRALPLRVWTTTTTTTTTTGSTTTATVSLCEALARVVVRLDTARLFRARGGEYVRHACCELLDACARRRLPLPAYMTATRALTGAPTRVRTVATLHRFLEETWTSSIVEWLQLAAARTFAHFARCYYCTTTTAAATMTSSSMQQQQQQRTVSAADDDNAVTYMQTFAHALLTRMLHGCAPSSSSSSPLERRGWCAAIGGVHAQLLLMHVQQQQQASEKNNNNNNDDESDSAAAAALPFFVHATRVLCATCHSPATTARDNESDNKATTATAAVTSACGDPETRRNAVVSLAALLRTAYKATCKTTTRAAAADVTTCRVQLLRCYVCALRAVQVALDDYDVDKRGDVGSLVRCAALRVLPDVVYHALALQQEQQQRREQQHDKGSSDVCRMTVVLLQQTVRLLMEKLDRVRGVAGQTLVRLLCTTGDAPRAPRLECGDAAVEDSDSDDSDTTTTTAATTYEVWPLLHAALAQSTRDGRHDGDDGATALDEVQLLRRLVQQRLSDATTTTTMTTATAASATAVTSGDDHGAHAHTHDAVATAMSVDWSLPREVMCSLAPPLLCAAPVTLAPPTLEGLVVSAGDVATHVQQPAMHALQCSFHGDDGTSGATASCVAASDDGAVARRRRRARLSALLVAVAERRAHCERVLVPWARATDALMGAAGVLDVTVHDRVVQVLRSELRCYATTIAVLLPLVTLLGSVCRSSCAHARRAAWTLSLTMIASRYPTVRARMAADLYTALLVLTSAAAAGTATATGGCGDSDAAAAMHEDALSTALVEGCQRAMTHLLATRWDDSDARRVRAARDALYDMLQLARPTTTTTTATTTDVNGTVAAAVAVGNSSNDKDDGSVADAVASAAAQSLEAATAMSSRATRGAVAASYRHLVREAGY